MVRVAVVAMVIEAVSVGASLRTSLVGNGYEDVVVGLSPLLQESEANEIIQAVKVSTLVFSANAHRSLLKRG